MSRKESGTNRKQSVPERKELESIGKKSEGKSRKERVGVDREKVERKESMGKSR